MLKNNDKIKEKDIRDNWETVIQNSINLEIKNHDINRNI